MALPTWNGKPVKNGDPAMFEAIEHAYEVARAAMSSVGVTDPEELLHAVEAVAWLETFSEASRHLLVPQAKVNGASWADLGAAMGVSRATAQSRFKQEVDEWEASVLQTARWQARTEAKPLSRMEPPIDFDPTDDEFVRIKGMPAWEYIGPLEPAIQWARSFCEEVKVDEFEGVHYVSSKRGMASGSTSADTEEEAWRMHLGGLLLSGRDDLPWADDAKDGETAAAALARLGARA